MKWRILPPLAAASAMFFSACSPSEASSGHAKPIEGKTAVLLVSHGSHSKRWREQLLQIEDKVRKDILALNGATHLCSAWMEYNEPSIATRLKEIDQLGYDNVILVPLLLRVSGHSFDDIPTIIGQKYDHSAALHLKAEGIEIYKPKAKVLTTPLMDFGTLLEANLERRIRKLSKNPQEEGVVLVAYGSKPYNEEWTALMERLGKALRPRLNIEHWTHAWCGHIASYKKEPTKKAISRILAKAKTAIVIPVLVAVDEMFQFRIIGGAIKDMAEKDRIRYEPDAILPEPVFERWIVQQCQKAMQGQLSGATK